MFGLARSVPKNCTTSVFNLICGNCHNVNLENRRAIVGKANPTLDVEYHEPSPKFQLVTDEEHRQFYSVFPELVDELVNDKILKSAVAFNQIPPKLVQCLHHSAKGRNEQGLITLHAYKTLEDANNLNEKNVRKAVIAGWCLELINTILTIHLEGIHADSPTRHQVNDALLIEQATYALLKNHFRDHPAYLELNDELIENLAVLTTGQVLNFDQSVENFTMESYEQKIRYQKEVDLSRGVTFGLYLANLKDSELHEQNVRVCSVIGKYLQAQNDFENLEEDVAKGKHTWLVSKAAQLADAGQKEIIRECYGREDEKAAQAIRRLYDELNLKREFEKFRAQSHEEASKSIEHCTHPKLKKVLTKLQTLAYWSN